MAVGRAVTQLRFDDAAALLGERLPPGTVYHLLAGCGQRLFGDDYFADLFTGSAKGRPTVPARVVATVMLLQAHEGLSDREAVEHLAFDLRWKAAAGLAVDSAGFHPTVLVGMRNRLRASARPRRRPPRLHGLRCEPPYASTVAASRESLRHEYRPCAGTSLGFAISPLVKPCVTRPATFAPVAVRSAQPVAVRAWLLEAELAEARPQARDLPLGAERTDDVERLGERYLGGSDVAGSDRQCRNGLKRLPAW